jgi:hypothetical protein
MITNKYHLITSNLICSWLVFVLNSSRCKPCNYFWSDRRTSAADGSRFVAFCPWPSSAFPTACLACYFSASSTGPLLVLFPSSLLTRSSTISQPSLLLSPPHSLTLPYTTSISTMKFTFSTSTALLTLASVSAVSAHAEHAAHHNHARAVQHNRRQGVAEAAAAATTVASGVSASIPAVPVSATGAPVVTPTPVVLTTTSAATGTGLRPLSEISSGMATQSGLPLTATYTAGQAAKISGAPPLPSPCTCRVLCACSPSNIVADMIFISSPFLIFSRH